MITVTNRMVLCRTGWLRSADEQLSFAGSIGVPHDDLSATDCRGLRMSNGDRVTIL
jgi:hypothetical protein